MRKCSLAMESDRLHINLHHNGAILKPEFRGLADTAQRPAGSGAVQWTCLQFNKPLSDRLFGTSAAATSRAAPSNLHLQLPFLKNLAHIHLHVRFCIMPADRSDAQGPLDFEMQGQFGLADDAHRSNPIDLNNPIALRTLSASPAARD